MSSALIDWTMGRLNRSQSLLDRTVELHQLLIQDISRKALTEVRDKTSDRTLHRRERWHNRVEKTNMIGRRATDDVSVRKEKTEKKSS